MKKSTTVTLIFLSTLAIGSCGKPKVNKLTNQEKDWTVQSSTNNEDSLTSYHRRSYGYWHMYPFLWHNSYMRRFGNTGRYAPSYFSRKGGFSVGNRSITRGGFGSHSKGGS